MSRENSPTKSPENNEHCFGEKQNQWNFPEHPVNIQQQNQNRRCCSPVDETDGIGEENVKSFSTHNVEVQTEKSTLLHLKQEKKMDPTKKNFVQNISNRELPDNRKICPPSGFGHEKIAERLANVNFTPVYDDYSETDSEQPMNYAYDENNLDEEKKRSTFYVNKTDLSCAEKSSEKDKIELNKSKGAYSKESKNKMANPRRSFKEIFNFFNYHEKKRSIDHVVEPLHDTARLTKTLEPYRHPPPPLVEQPEKDVQARHETNYSQSQQTPLMFSRSSSLSSLTGFEQHSIHDDRSSIVSDFSRRTSGAVSPSELPDSPAQSAPSGIRMQQKAGTLNKKNLFPQQDKLKNCQLPVGANDNSSFQHDGYYRKPAPVKDSVFEDDLTSFKDESTPVLHSMAASSLSSLTIDDDEDYDFMNKCIINKDKQTVSEEDTDDSSRKRGTGQSNSSEDSSIKSQVLPNISKVREENFALELAPFEEQLLDQYVRTGIAKLTKQDVNEIKPFSWDVGSICRSTRVMLTNTIIEEPEIDSESVAAEKPTKNSPNKNIQKNAQKDTQKDTNSQSGASYSKCSNSSSASTTSNSNKENDQFYGNPNYTTYEEHLLDQCIRRGISKKTKRNINLIRPFSWDVNQICLTTRAMMIRNRDDINFKSR